LNQPWAKPHVRAKVMHPFRVIKQHFGFQNARLRGMAKSRCKVNVIVVLANLFLAQLQLLAAK
jgi:IS5 family transposase